MPTERTEMTAREGQEEAFAAAMAAGGLALLRGVPGVAAVRFGRGVENPSRFLLLIDWTDMAAHAAYNETDACARFRALLRPYLTGAAMEHFELG